MSEVVAKRHESVPFMSVWLTMSHCENVAKSEYENVCENAYFIWTFLVECLTLYVDLHKVILNYFAFFFYQIILLFAWVLYIYYSPFLCLSYVGFNHLTN